MTRCPHCGRHRRVTPRLNDARREEIARARMAGLQGEIGSLRSVAQVARRFNVDHKTVTACVAWWFTESHRRRVAAVQS